jgi:hypothetical protein
MRVITNVPIITENTSNCCGTSSFDDFSYVNDKPKNENLSAVQDYLKNQKSARQNFRKESVTDILTNKTNVKDIRRGNRASNRDNRQVERTKRIQARFTRKANRKALKNAKKLTLVSTAGRDKFYFPLSRVRLGKKKYKDGLEVVVKSEDQVTAIDPKTQQIAVFDKVEIATAINKPNSEVSKQEAQKLINALPSDEVNKQNTKSETGDTANENTFGVLVDDSNVEVVADGEPYVKSQTQDSQEKDKDVKDKEKNKLTKNQKYLLYGIGVVAVGLIGFALYKNFSKGKSSN